MMQLSDSVHRDFDIPMHIWSFWRWLKKRRENEFGVPITHKEIITMVFEYCMKNACGTSYNGLLG